MKLFKWLRKTQAPLVAPEYADLEPDREISGLEDHFWEYTPRKWKAPFGDSPRISPKGSRS